MAKWYKRAAKVFLASRACKAPKVELRLKIAVSYHTVQQQPTESLHFSKRELRLVALSDQTLKLEFFSDSLVCSVQA